MQSTGQRGSHATPAGRSGAGSSSGGSSSGGPPGRDAESPTQVPAAGWKEILQRTKQQVKEDNVPLLAAGVAFYIFIALFPAIIAAISIYGIVADEDALAAQINSISSTLPRESADLIASQMKSITDKDESALGIGAVVAILSALFAASGGVQNLMKAINLAYDEKETRGFLTLRGTALLLTLAGTVFFVVAIGLVAVLPVVLEAINLGAVGSVLANVARFAALIAFMLVGLAVLYRYGPDRDNPQFRWVGLGSIVATVLWVIGSLGFSLYVSNFGKYGETYGALAGVVVLMLWLFLTSFIVLFGAEINSETEHQTAKDTTEGPERPMGERGATMADTVARG
jgi:membrane protein